MSITFYHGWLNESFGDIQDSTFPISIGRKDEFNRVDNPYTIDVGYQVLYYESEEKRDEDYYTLKRLLTGENFFFYN